jgi:DNA adenine methylase
MNKCKSILRWVGSKKRIINEIIENLPEEMNDYYEPFLGSGVVYLYVPNKSKSYINDNNKDLISLYKHVKKNHKEMIKLLEKLYKEYMSNDDDGKKEYYLEKRERFNKIKGKYDLERAVLYIFINKTCYNGIMQFNKYGNNSSGFGKLHNPNICDLKNIENLYNNLKNKTVIKNQDYLEFLKNVKKGDFIYLDPPYVPDDIKGCSIKYSSEIWNIDDFNNLVKLCEDLDKKGCKFMLSNSNSDFIRKNFSKNDYNIKKIKIARGLCPTSSLRKTEDELLIMNY